MTRETKRRLIAAAWLGALAALLAGIALQHHWDRQCAAGRWDSEIWECRS